MSDKRNLGDEIDDALDGINLQELDLPQTPVAGKDAPGQSGELKNGTVVGVDGTDVIVELGPRIQGVAQLDEFDEPPTPGQQFAFSIVGREDDLWLLSRKEAKALAALEDLDVGSHVKAKVTGQNTGGLELRLGGLAGFMPASHVAIGRVEDLSTFIGEHMVCEVLELDRGKKRLLLSRRNVLQQEADLARRETVGALTPGATVHGKVTRIEKFGAFVEITAGVEGLVHVSNMSRKRVEDPEEFVKVGQEVDAMILDIKEGGKRIGLGMKQLEPDPWDGIDERFRPEQMIEATVVKQMDFGVFMELEPGIEGLLHVSQLGTGGDRQGGRRKGGGPAVGEKLTVRIQSIDPIAQRISLSRLDSRGALLGSEEAAGASEIDEVLKSGEQSIGTNLGSLFKKALGDGE